MTKKKRLGEMLIDKGMIDQMQLDAALGRQKQWGGRMGSNLVKLGFISEITLIKFLSNQLNIQCADLSKVNFSKKIVSLISKEVSKKYHVIPLDVKKIAGKNFMFLAMSEPTDILAIDEIQFLTNLSIRPVIATYTQMDKAIEKFYDEKSWIQLSSLTETVPTIDTTKMEIFHEVPLREKIEMEEKKEATEKNTGVLALVRLLVKKGIITGDEYVKELKALKERKQS